MRPGYDKLHARILLGKGARKKKPNMFTVGSSTSATFVLPVRHGTCVAVQTKKMETDMLCGVMAKLKQVQKSANNLAIPTK